MLSDKEFLADDDDRYGPDTDLVRIAILTWIDLQNTGAQLNLKKYNIHTLPALPDNVTNLVIGNEHLVLIPASSIPSALTSISCTNAPNVRRIPALPNSVTYVNFSHCALNSLPKLPIGIKSIIAPMTNISEIPYLYSGIQELVVSGTNIRRIPCKGIPSTLFFLDVSGTKITRLPRLNRGLRTLNISNTAISVLPEFPNTLINLYVHNCLNLIIQRETNGPMHVAGVESISSYSEKWDAWREKYYEKLRSEERSSIIYTELISKVFRKPLEYDI